MRRLLLTISLSAIVGVTAAVGTAVAGKTLDSLCRNSGANNYCLEVKAESGRIDLIFRSFSGRMNPYALCVVPPTGGRGECNTFRLIHQRQEIFASRIDFARNFADSGPGSYSAYWSESSKGIGVAVNRLNWGHLDFSVH